MNEKMLQGIVIFKLQNAQLVADIFVQKDTIISENDEQITTLEDKFARVQAELEAERQQ